MAVINAHTHHLLAFSFGLLGNLVSFMVYLSPLPTFNTEGFQSIPYYVVALFSAMLWMFYTKLATKKKKVITTKKVEFVTISLFLFLTLCTQRATAAPPIITPDYSKCGSAEVPVPTGGCPPPTNLEVVDFKVPQDNGKPCEPVVLNYINCADPESCKIECSQKYNGNGKCITQSRIFLQRCTCSYYGC